LHAIHKDKFPIIEQTYIASDREFFYGNSFPAGNIQFLIQDKQVKLVYILSSRKSWACTCWVWKNENPRPSRYGG